MARSDFDKFVRSALDFLEDCEVPHLVIGGLAVLVVGEPRITADVDAIVFLSRAEAVALIGEAERSGFALNPSVERERLDRTGTLRFRRGRYQLDLILASLPFEAEALRRATKHKIFGKSVRFPTPEDLILFKVLAGREKDNLDAKGIARRHRDRLDRKYIEETLRSICDLAEDMAPWQRLELVLREATER